MPAASFLDFLHPLEFQGILFIDDVMLDKMQLKDLPEQRILSLTIKYV